MGASQRSYPLHTAVLGAAAQHATPRCRPASPPALATSTLAAGGLTPPRSAAVLPVDGLTRTGCSVAGRVEECGRATAGVMGSGRTAHWQRDGQASKRWLTAVTALCEQHQHQHQQTWVAGRRAAERSAQAGRPGTHIHVGIITGHSTAHGGGHARRHRAQRQAPEVDCVPGAASRAERARRIL